MKILSLLVVNIPGVMYRVTSLFTRRGFNIESITTGKSEKNDMLRLIIGVEVDDKALEQVEKQLYKIVSVVKVSVLKVENSIRKELAFIKIRKVKNQSMVEIYQTLELLGGEIVDISKKGIIAQIFNLPEMVDSFIDSLPAGIIYSITRTGILAVEKWQT